MHVSMAKEEHSCSHALQDYVRAILKSCCGQRFKTSMASHVSYSVRKRQRLRSTLTSMNKPFNIWANEENQPTECSARSNIVHGLLLELKKWAFTAGITKNITFHTGRHYIRNHDVVARCRHLHCIKTSWS
jgi:hypothetical protein